MIKNVLVVLAVVFTGVFFTGSAFAEEVSGFCSHVVDGNTLVMMAGGTPYTVKLGYIDAPEADQKFGYEAKKFVEELALKKNIKLKEVEPGDGVLLAEVFSPKKQDSINRLLVREGLAWAKQGDERYALAQAFAKKRSLGIWSLPGIQSPEESRAQKEKQLQATKEKEEELRKGKEMEMIIQRSDYEDKIAKQSPKQSRNTVESTEITVAQQPDPIIETRPGYRAEDVEAEAQRLRAEQQAKEREDYCRQGFSSAHSGVGEYSRQQREMEFNEWAIKCGADAPYKSPDVVIVDKRDDGHHRNTNPYINKDPYNIGNTNIKKSNSKPGTQDMKPQGEQIQK